MINNIIAFVALSLHDEPWIIDYQPGALSYKEHLLQPWASCGTTERVPACAPSAFDGLVSTA